MLRTLCDVAWMFAYLISRYPVYLRARRLQKQGRAEEAAAIFAREVNRWTDKLFKIIHMDVAVEGAENLPQNGETVVYVANHQSYIDIPVVLTRLDAPHPILAKEELAHIPFLSAWMRVLGCIFVARDDLRAAAAALHDATELVEHGTSLIVFPEGTRSKTGEIAEFKGGAMRAAIKNNVPIIPLMIDGTLMALEGNHYRIQPAHVRLVILPRIETAGMTREQQKALPDRLTALVRAAKEQGRIAAPEGAAGESDNRPS